MAAVTDTGKKLKPCHPSKRTAVDNGHRPGTAYRLKSGEVICVQGTRDLVPEATESTGKMDSLS